MANLACDLPTVEFIGKAMDPCKEDFAGIGYIIYAVNPADLKVKPKYDTGVSKMRFTADSFARSNFKAGKYAYKIICKKNNAQNQGTGNEGAGKGAAQSLTFTVENDIENAAYALRLMKNIGDFYFLCTKGENTYQVVGDPDWGSNLNFNYDSGQEATSGSGLMATVSCPTAPSPVVFWMPDAGDDIATKDNPGSAAEGISYTEYFEALGVANETLSTLTAADETAKAEALSSAIETAKTAIADAASQQNVDSAVSALKSAIKAAL